MHCRFGSRLHTMFLVLQETHNIIDNTVFPLSPLLWHKVPETWVAICVAMVMPLLCRSKNATFIMASMDAHTHTHTRLIIPFTVSIGTVLLSATAIMETQCNGKTYTLKRTCIHVFFLGISKYVHIPSPLFLHPHTENKENIWCS